MSTTVVVLQPETPFYVTMMLYGLISWISMWAMILLSILLSWSITFINDTKFDITETITCKILNKCGPGTIQDGDDYIFVLFMLLFGGAICCLAWPLAILGLIFFAGIHSLRFSTRVCKKLGKLG